MTDQNRDSSLVKASGALRSRAGSSTTEQGTPLRHIRLLRRRKFSLHISYGYQCLRTTLSQPHSSPLIPPLSPPLYTSHLFLATASLRLSLEAIS